MEKRIIVCALALLLSSCSPATEPNQTSSDISSQTPSSQTSEIISEQSSDMMSSQSASSTVSSSLSEELLKNPNEMTTDELK